MKYGKIIGGVVVSVVDYGDKFKPDGRDDLVEIDETPPPSVSPFEKAVASYFLDAGTVTQQWSIQTADVPEEITMRQARLALFAAGLLAGVQSAIDALSEPTKSAAQIEWDYSNALRRDNTFVHTLGPALGLTAEQIDQLFIQGARL